MPRGAFLALVLLATCLAPRARGDLALDGATVLASPGVPSAWAADLPRGRAPSALAWPLPDGPLLVLGLIDRDPRARDLGEALGVIDPGEDLAGGYVVAGWWDGDRPVGVVLADGAAALLAARSDLGAARDAALGRAPEGPGLGIPEGVRRVTPGYARRAIDGGAHLAEAVETALRHRADAVWIDLDRASEDEIRAALLRLAPRGVVPVPRVTARTRDEVRAAGRRLASWPARGAVEGAVVLANAALTPRRARSPLEAALRGSGLERLVVVPASSSAPLVAVPGIAWAWRIPPEGPEPGQVEARRREAGGSLLLYEGFFAPLDAPGAPPRVPCLPPGRPADLSSRFAGIVVGGMTDADDLLDAAWFGREAGPEPWEPILLPLLPPGAEDPVAFLRESAARLGAEARRTHDAVPWMRPLSAAIGRDADRVAANASGARLVPRVPAPVVLDGRLDEAAWSYAVRVGGVLVLSDGHRLVLGLRAPFPKEVVLGDAVGGTTRIALSEGGPAVRADRGRPRLAQTGRSAEVAIDAATLVGEPYPTRALDLEVVPGGDRAPPERYTLVLAP